MPFLAEGWKLGASSRGGLASHILQDPPWILLMDSLPFRSSLHHPCGSPPTQFILTPKAHPLPCPGREGMGSKEPGAAQHCQPCWREPQPVLQAACRAVPQPCLHLCSTRQSKAHLFPVNPCEHPLGAGGAGNCCRDGGRATGTQITLPGMKDAWIK